MRVAIPLNGRVGYDIAALCSHGLSPAFVPRATLGSGEVTERGHASHYTDLDGMRGVLACGVMFFHLGFGQAAPILTRGAILNGAWILCVDFFFVLSGFVLFYSVEKSRPTFGRYAEKRLRRLAPMFLLTTAAMLFLRSDNRDAFTVIANTFMAQTFLGMPSINTPGWSIPLELFLPAFMLVLVPRLVKLADSWIIALLVAALVGGGVLGYFCALGIEYHVLRGAFGLGSGMLLACLHARRRPQKGRPGLVLVLFGFALLVMALGPTYPALGALFYCASAATIYSGAQVRTFLSGPVFQALGRWSYSIYLVHVPVMWALRPWTGENQAITSKFLVVGLTLVLAAACYRWIELPWLKGGSADSRKATKAQLQS